MMDRRTPSHEIDPILLPFLRAPEGLETQQVLEQLISQCAEPIVRKIIRQKLRTFSSRARDQDSEDVYGDAIVQLIRRLRELKASPQRPITNFQSYVATLSYNACYEYLRHRYPERHCLKSKLRYLLTNQPGFALWKSEGKEWLCGFASWRDLPEAPRASVIGPHALARAGLTSVAAQRKNLPEMVATIFNCIAAPVEMDDLVNVVADLCGIKDQQERRLPVEDEQEGARFIELVPDPRSGVASEVELRIYLQRLWSEICQLPPRQRAALLLNLSDAEGRDVIALLPITGIATPRQIAETVEMPPEQFAALWNDLPMDDATIARHLAVTRQQVINLRKSARQRLARRMRGS
jgi:RNA polymerase sigma factor (sigma-70 family)